MPLQYSPWVLRSSSRKASFVLLSRRRTLSSQPTKPQALAVVRIAPAGPSLIDEIADDRSFLMLLARQAAT